MYSLHGTRHTPSLSPTHLLIHSALSLSAMPPSVVVVVSGGMNDLARASLTAPAGTRSTDSLLLLAAAAHHTFGQLRHGCYSASPPLFPVEAAAADNAFMAESTTATTMATNGCYECSVGCI